MLRSAGCALNVTPVGHGTGMRFFQDQIEANKVVQRAVLQSPRLTDQEVETFAAMSSLTDEVLRLIAGNRTFRKNYVVVRNLINNPKTPLDVTLHMLPILNPQDLKRLTTNKNVPETLRTTASKLQRTRADQKK